MSAREKPPPGGPPLDDTVPLTAVIEASQNLQSHTVSAFLPEDSPRFSSTVDPSPVFFCSRSSRFCLDRVTEKKSFPKEGAIYENLLRAWFNYRTELSPSSVVGQSFSSALSVIVVSLKPICVCCKTTTKLPHPLTSHLTVR